VSRKVITAAALTWHGGTLDPRFNLLMENTYLAEIE